MDEIERLKKVLAARTDSDGKPLSGYKLNVADMKKQIARLEEDGAWFYVI